MNTLHLLIKLLYTTINKETIGTFRGDINFINSTINKGKIDTDRANINLINSLLINNIAINS